MTRKEITEFLGNLLIKEKFSGMGKYWASEVTLDHGWGAGKEKRVDFMKFEPPKQMNISDIEKGIFTCYEIKSCKADFNSGFGKNFIGEKNYFVMPMSTYKEVIQEIPHGVGVLVPIPRYCSDKYMEFESPTKLEGDIYGWKLWAIKTPLLQGRKRSMVELLFCMVRSGKKEAPVVHGEWIETSYGDFLQCNQCKKILCIKDIKDNYSNNFCPNCGADMRKPELVVPMDMLEKILEEETHGRNDSTENN